MKGRQKETKNKEVEIMKFKRLWDCAVCGQNVFFDSETNKMSCNCGSYIRVYPPALKNFIKINN